MLALLPFSSTFLSQKAGTITTVSFTCYTENFCHLDQSKFHSLVGRVNTLPDYKIVNSLPNDKNLDSSTKFKAFADDNLNVAKMAKFVFDRVENIAGKGENAAYQHFLSFSHNVFKWLLCQGCWDCVVNQ